MSEVNDLLNDVSEIDNGIKRDRWGRYVLPDPETGEIKPWTRATTLANIMDDTTSLDVWKTRNLIYGIGCREDLFALAASVSGAELAEDKETLDGVAAAAEEIGGGNVKSNLGTAMHGFTQRLDLGDDTQVPSEWSKDIEAYLAEMKNFGLWTHENFVEKVVLVPELGVAGTIDRLLMGDDLNAPVTADLKTGKVKGKGRSFAIQLAIYSRATHWFDPTNNELHEMPKMDQERGLIIHLPIGEAKCTFHEIDLVAGWEQVLIASQVHSGRSRNDFSKPLSKWGTPAEKPARKSRAKSKTVTEDEAVATVVEVFGKKTEVHDTFTLRWAWIRSRVGAIIGHGHRDALATEWSITAPGVPGFKKGGPTTNEEIDLVAEACSLVEKANGMPFPQSGDPAVPITTKNNYVQEQQSA